MTDAETILKMIETVDPADAAKLDEIDARVWCYTNHQNSPECYREFLAFEKHQFVDEDCPEIPMPEVYALHYRQRFPFNALFNTDQEDKWTVVRRHYTRSRDALKGIRPDNARVFIHHYSAGWHASATMRNMVFSSGSGNYQTEELAELHAIIQAVEHERSLTMASS